MSGTLEAVLQAGEDFEWYPTTQRMIDVVAQHLPTEFNSLMDLGAGDGRVLIELAKRSDRATELYAIEKSAVLVQSQPENVTPVGTDLFEQNLACLPVDYIFCNPPYSQFETWVSMIVESGYAKKAFLVIPRRWKDSHAISLSLKKREAKARVIHTDDFLDAERRARAVVDIVEVSYPRSDYRHEDVKDPFDAWFDANIDTFDTDPKIEKEQAGTEMARLRGMANIGELVEAFDEEYARMEENYRAIFKLDHALLKELGVSKDGIRDGIKKRMAGLKTKYWQLLFERLDTITNRLSTKTKAGFLEKLTRRTSIAFTSSNAYAVVLWAIKNANKYFDEQTVQLFRDLSTFEGVMNYKSNQKTWNQGTWRYHNEDHSHYALDYRIVVKKYSAIASGDSFSKWESPGGLHKNCHELIEDATAVFYNLGFSLGTNLASRERQWSSGEWQDFYRSNGEDVLFQTKAHKNGSLHFRIMPEAIKALNVEAGRLLGWLKTHEDVVEQLGYTPDEARAYFGSSLMLGSSSLKLLGGVA